MHDLAELVFDLVWGAVNAVLDFNLLDWWSKDRKRLASDDPREND